MRNGVSSGGNGHAAESTSAPAARRVQMFVNPIAGSWARRHVAALEAGFRAAGAAVVVTLNPRDRPAIDEAVDHVCAVGGDGTAREVVATMLRAPNPPAMSVYPLGTVNLLARECGYTTDTTRFVRRAMARGAPRRHHIALIGDTPMLTCASVGPDSHAVDRLSPRLKQAVGRAAYIVAFCAVLIRWPRHGLRLVADGREIRCEAVYIAKGRYFAGGWSFAPAAAVEDPLLHVVALPSASRGAVLRFALALLRRRAPQGVVRLTCAHLTIEGGDGAPLQADGDIVARLPIAIGIAAETITFV